MLASATRRASAWPTLVRPTSSEGAACVFGWIEQRRPAAQAPTDVRTNAAVMRSFTRAPFNRSRPSTRTALDGDIGAPQASAPSAAHGGQRQGVQGVSNRSKIVVDAPGGG